jgi:glycosyltransferase involved in cell wall biosynthesis
MADPVISIIIPCYNVEKLLPECLDAVLAQEYDSKEVIIVDGGSTDKTLEILRQYSAKYRIIKWVSEKDRGVYDAMNKGVGMATGEWVYFLGADDCFYDANVLSGIFSAGRTVGVAAAASGSDIIYGNVEFKYSRQIYNGPYDLKRVLLESNICHQAIFYRRSVFEKVGSYDIGCKVYADRDFNIRCFLQSGLKIRFLDRIIAVYNEQDGLSAQEKSDPCFRQKQQKYIEDYNKKPVRAFVIRLRHFARVLKTNLLQTGKR